MRLFQNDHVYKPIPTSNDDVSTFLESPPPSTSTISTIPSPQKMKDNSIFALPRKAGENFTLLFKFRDDPIISTDVDEFEREKNKQKDDDKDIIYGIRKPTNPFRLLATLSISQWLILFSGCLALFADFLDFGVLAVGTKKIAAYYGTTKSRVSDSITYTMALRIIGAIFFGILGDLYGRRLPLVIDLIMLGGLQIGSIYCKSVNVFIGIRALFGIAMGGIYSNAASTLMEGIQPELRGLLGAIYQSSAACSGLVGAGLNMAFGDKPETWKKMFWVSAGVSFFAAFIRFLVPDSEQFRQAKKKIQLRQEAHQSVMPDGTFTKKDIIQQKLKPKAKFVQFFKELRVMFSLHWQTFIYCAIFLCLMSWASHSYDDNYVTFLLSGKGINNRKASIIAMITKTGSIIGQIVIGWLGEFVGRRRVALIGTIFAAALLPAALLPSDFVGLCVGGWFFQFFLHAYGCVVAAHFNELAPKAFRSLLPGVSYQLGTTISAPAAMIVNLLAEKRIITLNGKRVQAYQPVMLIIVEICCFLMIILAAFGPERRGADLQHFKPAGLESSSQTTSMEEEEEDLKRLNSHQMSIRSIPLYE